ncbi:MAG: glycosyltransferase [Leptolyngbya sp. SIO4C1]|nr:glycosyltransferase [Leptolyngbya sp. SIO4C1]
MPNAAKVPTILSAMLKLLHVIPRLSNAGPTRTLLVVVQALAEMGLPIRHRLLVLDGAVHPFVSLRVRKAGITLLKQLEPTAIRAEIESADIVQVHFWNHPKLYEFLRTDWPAMRLLIWFKIFGAHAPQVITTDLVNCADACLVSSAGSLDLPCFQSQHAQDHHPDLKNSHRKRKVNLALSPANLQRLGEIEPQPHDCFNVGYIGTANFTKVHPSYVEMSAAIDIDPVRFIICGGNDQDLVAAVQDLGVCDRFDFRGYVEHIEQVLAILDVFGYPLCADTYATSEQALQEAMYAAVPPVVFPHSGVATLVQDQVTGRVVHSEAEYTQAIEELFHNPSLRKSLGKQARAYAQEHFRPLKTAQIMEQTYDELMSQTKQGYKGLTQPVQTPAEGFVAALGQKGDTFWTSLRGQPSDWQRQDIEAAHVHIAKTKPDQSRKWASSGYTLR